MSYFVFPDTGRNEKNELTVHTRTVLGGFGIVRLLTSSLGRLLRLLRGLEILLLKRLLRLFLWRFVERLVVEYLLLNPVDYNI